MKEFELVINFKSDKEFYEIRDYCINHLLEEKFFDNMQLWNIRRIENGMIPTLQKENAELKETLQHREHCIDWITENYPEVISKYLERKE